MAYSSLRCRGLFLGNDLRCDDMSEENRFWNKLCFGVACSFLGFVVGAVASFSATRYYDFIKWTHESQMRTDHKLDSVMFRINAVERDLESMRPEGERGPFQ